MIKVKEITPKNVKAFIQGYLRKFLIDYFNRKLKYIFEQVEYRTECVREKSPECLTEGSCKVCGCKIPELFYSDKGCSNINNPCYPEMYSENEWIRFKNLKSIKNGTLG
jgi:hypothetical protein